MPAIPQLVKSLKGVPTRRPRQEFPLGLRCHYRQATLVVWAASSPGPPTKPDLRPAPVIEQQKRPT